MRDEALIPRRELEIRFRTCEECPECHKYAFVEVEVNSNIENDPHEGLLGKKCMWCGHRSPAK